MTRIGSQSPPVVAPREHKPIEQVAAKALEPAKAQFLQQLLEVDTTLLGRVDGGAQLVAGAQPASEAGVAPGTLAAFAELATRLAPPAKGAEIGKQFAAEATADAAVRLDDAQVAAGAGLMGATLPPGENARLLKQYDRFFTKLVEQPQPPLPTHAVMQQKLKETGFVATYRAFVKGPHQEVGANAAPPAKEIGGFTQSLLSEKSFASMEASDLVELVMLQLGQDVDTEVREFLKEMKDGINKKQAKASLLHQYKEAQAKADQQVQSEFNTLLSMDPPRLGKGVTLEEYKAWRQISWPDPTTNPSTGEMRLGMPHTAQPFPPDLPAILTQDKTTKEIDPATKKAAPSGSADPTVKYGIPTALKDYLHDVYMKLSLELIGSSDTSPTSKMPFDAWLSSAVGLSDAASVDDVRHNAEAANAFLQKGLKDQVAKVDSTQRQASADLLKKISDTVNALAARRGQIDGGRGSDVPDLLKQLKDYLPFLQGAKACYLSPADRDTLKALVAQVGDPNPPDGSSNGTGQDELDALAVALDAPPDSVQLYPPNGRHPVVLPSNADLNQIAAGALGAMTDVPSISDAVLAAALKKNLDQALLAGNLSADQKAAITQISYSADDPAGFLQAIEDLVAKKEFRPPDGANAAFTNTLIGGAVGGASGEGKAGVSGALDARVQVHTSTSTVLRLASTVAFGVGDDGAVQPGGTVAPLPDADPAQVSARLRALLLGDASGVVLSPAEKKLIKAGVIADPSDVAARKQQLTAQTQKDKVAAAGAGGRQMAAPGDAHLGTLAELGNEQEKVKAELDSMGELNQLQSMRLQMLMDRRAKFAETLSNIMKKLSGTADAIASNMK